MADLIAAWLALDERYQATEGSRGELYHTAHGTAPLVFSAPHSVRQLRAGAQKRADIRTGGLAELLARHARGRVLACTGSPSDDPSWHDGPTPFRAKLLRLLRADDLVADIHGMGDGHAADVVIGLGPAPGVTSRAAAERLAAHLEVHGLTARIGHPFPALHPGTVTAFVQAAGFSALQVEIAACRRHPLREPERARPLVAALTAWSAAGAAGTERAIS